MVGGGRFRLQPGEWSDDTSIPLCLGASLLEKGGFNPNDQMKRYCRWWKQGEWSCNGHCFDIGNAVEGALERFLQTGDPLLRLHVAELGGQRIDHALGAGRSLLPSRS